MYPFLKDVKHIFIDTMFFIYHFEKEAYNVDLKSKLSRSNPFLKSQIAIYDSTTVIDSVIETEADGSIRKHIYLYDLNGNMTSYIIWISNEIS